MMKDMYISAMLLVAITCSINAHAAASPQIEAQSTQLLETGNARAAFDLLAKEQKTDAQDWFLYGMAAHQAGQFDEAESAYRTVLRLDPSSSRAKLELGTVLSDKGNWPESRRLLLDVKAENPPERVRQNIDRYLAVIDKKEGEYSTWRVTASAGIMYDSNVNNGTSANTVTMFGLPFTLSDDAKVQADFAYTMRFEADHVARLSERTSWQSNFSFNWTDYVKHNQFDVLQLSAYTGPVFQLNPKTVFSLPVTADLAAYTDKGDIYSTSVGVAPQVRYQATEKLALSLESNINWKHFIGNSDRNTLSYSLAPALDFKTCGQGSFRFGGSVGREDSGVDTYSNDNWGLNTSLFCPLGADLAFSIYGSYGETTYDAKEAAYTVARHDKKATVGANLQYAHKLSGLDGSLGVSYTHNESNLELYEFNKVQVSASVKKKW